MWHSGDWKVRKEERRKQYMANHGLKMITCTACSGFGYYDNNGSPKCGGCSGTGKVREHPSDRDRRLSISS